MTKRGVAEPRLAAFLRREGCAWYGAHPAACLDTNQKGPNCREILSLGLIFTYRVHPIDMNETPSLCCSANHRRLRPLGSPPGFRSTLKGSQSTFCVGSSSKSYLRASRGAYSSRIASATELRGLLYSSTTLSVLQRRL